MSAQALREKLQDILGETSPKEGKVTDVLGDKVFIATNQGLIEKLKGDENIRIGHQVKINGDYCYSLPQDEYQTHYV